jgi:hypothetical protein
VQWILGAIASSKYEVSPCLFATIYHGYLFDVFQLDLERHTSPKRRDQFVERNARYSSFWTLSDIIVAALVRRHERSSSKMQT